MDRRSHWRRVWREKAPDSVSWYQREPQPSLEMVLAYADKPGTRILDVGGGASPLADHLVAAGHRPTMLDISPEALDIAKARLRERSVDAAWIVADVTDFRPRKTWDVWHDRAVFHFLTDAEDRRAYVESLDRALVPGGGLVLGTFALDGPRRCSGLDVQRYGPDELAEAIGPGYCMEESRAVDHTTPGGGVQRFTFARFRRTGAPEG